MAPPTATAPTIYFETLPSNQLRKWPFGLNRIAWAFCRIHVTHSEFRSAALDGEKANEDRITDNRPYGLVGQCAVKNMYPYRHPYSWLTWLHGGFGSGG
jgi:zinc protease